MKLLRNRKLNSKGFGQVELIIVAVVVVVVAGAGYFVLQNHKNTNVSHAGSWQYVGASAGVSFYACKQLLTNGGIESVRGLATGTNLNGEDIAYMDNYAKPGGALRLQTSTSSWSQGQSTQLEQNVNILVPNYFTFYVGKANNTPYVSAGSLPLCP